MCICVEGALYLKHGSCMHVDYLASKAFDGVNHIKLFLKLLKLGVSKYLIKVICQWYYSQTVC